MDILVKIAEQKIREAIERVSLTILPIMANRSSLTISLGVPDTLRMGYTILKNAGILPPEMQLKKDILALRTCSVPVTTPRSARRWSTRCTRRCCVLT